ncbi:MAG: C25 family cysteine peptidase, partial [Bacteroidales bacterium]
IKNYLQGLYDTPDDGTAPTFVLLVGDVAQIPTFSGNSASHVTDLYYYTLTGGDNLPDVFGGRFSATTIEHLQSQIDKTLQIEKYLMPDPSYLNNVVLIAGVDGTYAPTYGNGFVNYSNDNYTNPDNGITSYYYLYNDASGVMMSNSPGASASFQSYISAGVSLANYTAHCSSSGWYDPAFSIANIANLTNTDMYPLMIGNCCQSLMFGETTCFGEEIVRAVNKGAVGYIGASNSTYWDEDYYWGIGKRASISANPTYDAANLGAYDRFFHSHSEAKDDWFTTQGQINVAGNLAVEASSSTRKLYYWEIYHLMGDPSLVPYVKEPTTLISSHENEIIIGTSSFEVIAEEDAYVALSFNGDLLDAKIAGADGLVNLSFSGLDEVGTAKLVITKQNRIPKIADIAVIPSTTPYVIKDFIEINDELGNNNNILEYGENIKLSVQLKNVSEAFDAYNVVAKLSSTDTNVVIIDSLETYGTILTDTVSLIDDAFTIEIENDIIDQTLVNFNLEITGTDYNSNLYTWKSTIDLYLNAPAIEIGNILIDDYAGDNDGILDPGETANLQLIVSNTGHASINDLNALVVMLNNGDTIIDLNTSVINNIFMEDQSTDTLEFNITANSLADSGQKVYFDFQITDIINNFYSIQAYRELIIGEIPSVLISEQGSIEANQVCFYDSGGELNNYSDDEDYLITFRPIDTNENIQVEFLSFEIESHSTCDYDYLTIYDGLTTTDPIIGKYCGTNSPGKIIATNPNGALTFVFHSDDYETKKGWKAMISSIKTHSYSLLVTNNNGPMQGASVTLNDDIITTLADGIATFENVPEGINIPLKVTAIGFSDHIQTINLFENSSDTVLLNIAKHNITFKLFDKTDQSIIDGEITFNGISLSTIQGQAIFNDVEYALDKEYIISSYGYNLYTDTLDVTEDITKQILLEPLRYDVTFVVNGSEGLVENALINFNNEDKLTNSNGEAVFNDVPHNSNYPYLIRKPDYENYLDTIDVYSDVTENVTLAPGTAIYQVSLSVTDETNPIEAAVILFDGQEKSTDTEGNCIFDSIEYGLNKKYTITKDKYYQYTDSIDVDSNLAINVSMTLITFDITFQVTSNENSGPLQEVIVAF